jgi:predicted O-linked N-acetylglucosamine transferase (SPINDLY family)
MGVPVLTLEGKTTVSRQGVRFLRSAGLEGLIARAATDYARMAIELAGDLERLETLRFGLRERMKRSPLMDASGVTRNLEAAYRCVCG